MAERPRRPSSELGSEPTPPKRRRTSGERGTEPTTEGEREQEQGTPGSEAGQRRSSSSPERLGSPTPPAASTSSVESSVPSTSRETEADHPPPLAVLPPSSDASTSTVESPVPSTSRGTEADPPPPLALLPPSSDSSTVTGTMEAGPDEGLTIQASLLREHAQYHELLFIGNGAYGTVYKARDFTSGQVVALKKVRVPITGDGLPQSTLREIVALKQLERYEHPHIVRLLDVCQGPYLTLPPGDERSETADRGLTLWLVFEHVERDLASFMESCPPPGIPGYTIRQMSKDILLGVDFLHSHRIVHRDLKPQNLLVTSQGRIKIADFGLAKTYDFEMRLTTVVVTLWYRSPEVLLGCAYATPVDIWSVGCILAELCRRNPLFPGTSEGDQLDRIFQVIGTPPQEEWPEDVSLGWTAFPRRQPTPLRSIIPDLPDSGLDLLDRILTFDPHSRLTAAQALAHPYFTDESS